MPRAPHSGITEGQESPTIWWPTLLSCPIVPCAPHLHLPQTLILCTIPAAISHHGLGRRLERCLLRWEEQEMGKAKGYSCSLWFWVPREPGPLLRLLCLLPLT